MASVLGLGSIAGCSGQNQPTTAAVATEATVTAAETTGAAAETTAEAETKAESAVVPAMEGDTFGNAAVGTHGGVTSSSPLASEIGLEILKAGGNAVDAAVATSFAVGVVEPQYSGIGGAGLMNIYLNDEKECKVIEYLETVPQAITPGWYNSETDKYTAKNAAIPSQVHGLLTALERYGTMSREEVLAPVIKLAKEGYEINDTLGLALMDGYDRILGSEAATAIYTDEEIPYTAGQKIVNEPLANTLQTISDGGIEAFYKGELAQHIVDELQSAGSLITMEDMASYTSVEREPISTTYFGYDVVTVPAPSNGGNMLLETLNILENYDLKAMGHNSYDYLLTMNEAMRIGWRDAYVCLGDPAFFNLPVEKMISKEYAKTRLECMPEDGISKYIGVQPPAGDLEVSRVGDAPDSQHTTHISVIDQYGNIVSTTNTLGLSWGCGYMAEDTGFFFNSHISNMTHDPEKSDSADFVVPGKRIRSTMSPTIVLKDAEPVMAIGSPGSLAISPAIITVLNNVILFDMNMQQAINAPRGIITTRSKPYSKMTVEADRLDPEVVQKFVDGGYTMDNKGEYDLSLGGIAAIYLDQETGEFQAGADPRREYQARAY